MRYFALGLVLILFSLSNLLAMPPVAIDSDEELHGNHNIDRILADQIIKRMSLPQWLDKRNPGLCDYRLQYRPLPLSSALCAYGQSV